MAEFGQFLSITIELEQRKWTLFFIVSLAIPFYWVMRNDWIFFQNKTTTIILIISMNWQLFTAWKHRVLHHGVGVGMGIYYRHSSLLRRNTAEIDFQARMHTKHSHLIELTNPNNIVIICHNAGSLHSCQTSILVVRIFTSSQNHQNLKTYHCITPIFLIKCFTFFFNKCKYIWIRNGT